VSTSTSSPYWKFEAITVPLSAQPVFAQRAMLGAAGAAGRS
jgi:hypothetical protein